MCCLLVTAGGGGDGINIVLRLYNRIIALESGHVGLLVPTPRFASVTH